MRRTPSAIPILAALLCLYLAAPFAAGLGRVGAADWHQAGWQRIARAGVVSAGSASAATLLIALGGIPLGYLLARRRTRAMAALGFLVQMPLALPPLTSGILLLFLLGDASPIGRLTRGALTDSIAGIVLAEMFVAAPFLVVAARAAFAAIDPALEDVASTLGHRPAAVFRRVGLALGWRTIAAGLLLAWLRAFGEFGATVMVAYHPYSLPVLTYVAFGGEGLPAMLPILLPTMAVAVAVMALSQLAFRLPARGAQAAGWPSPLAARLLDEAPGPGPRPGPRVTLALYRRLDDFELDVSWRTEARRLAILGPSGSGKSLTLRLIAGLDDGASEVGFGGRDLARLPPEARGIAYVPQSYALMPHLTVAEQVRFAARADPALASHWTRRLGLEALGRRRPHELSLGQQQRVALARALSRGSAGLLLLDEPFSALDAGLRARTRQELRTLQDDIEATTVLVTHDAAEALLLADELLLLDGGRVLQAGPASMVFARPANELAARLLGAETIGHGTVARPDAIDLGEVLLPVAGAPLTPGMRVGWAARPSQIRLCAAGAPGLAASLLSRGAVSAGQRRVALRLGESVLDMLADPDCPPAGPCAVRIDPASVQVWPA